MLFIQDEELYVVDILIHLLTLSVEVRLLLQIILGDNLTELDELDVTKLYVEPVLCLLSEYLSDIRVYYE